LKRQLWLLLAACFVAGVVGGRLLWFEITAPFQATHGIISPATQAGFHPATNVLRVLVWLALPPLLLLLSYWRNLGGLRERLREAGFWSRTIEPDGRPGHARALGLLLVLACTLAISINLWGSKTLKFDTFHDGESLVAGLSWQAGQVPYRDFLFVHGLLQDPGRAVLAFWLFGESIGALHAVHNILKAAAFLLLAGFLWKAFRGHMLWVLLGAVLVAGLLASTALPHKRLPFSAVLVSGRDLCTFAFLLCAAAMADWLRDERSPRRVSVLLLFTGTLLAITAFLVSVDRGYFLTATAVCAWPVFLVGASGRGVHWSALAGACGAGLVAGVLVLMTALGPGFKEFLWYVFVDLVRYKELIDGLEYPISRPAFLLSLLLLAFGVFFVWAAFLHGLAHSGNCWREAVRRFARERFLEWSLLLVVLFTFRMALGQADISHLRMAILPAYVLLLYVAIRYWVHPWAARTVSVRRLTAVGTAAWLLLFAVAAGYIWRGRLLPRWLPVSVSDDSVVPDHMKDVARYLRSRMGPNDSLYTLDSLASWYYLVGRPCPSRYPIAYLAAHPDSQREVVQALESSRVRYVLQASRDCPDKFLTQPRRMMPILQEYVDARYRLERTIDRWEIMVRNSP